jgi:hypothetical protein
MRRFLSFALGEWRRYCIAVFGVALVWAAVMAASQSTTQQSASPTAPHAAAVGAVTLRSIDPSLAGKIGFNNPSYANLIPGARSGDLGPGGLSERFTAPDGKPITIAIVAPRVGSTYDVPPIQSGQDPSVYFANAIAGAGAHKTIRFPRGGAYDFPAAACQRLGAHLKINAAQDVVIDGNGSVLNFSSPCPGIAFVNPVRVAFKNFTIDWPKLQIASLGTVVDAGGGGPRRFTYAVQLDREYVSSAMPRSYKSINAWDAARGFWSLQHPDHEVGYSPRQPLSAAGSAENVQSWAARFAKGERVILRHYTTEGDAIDIYHGQDVSLDNVTIYTSPGFGIAVLQGSSGLAISNCKVTRAPGRPISTAADALHVTNSGGDILIENNVFAYQGDDGLNINAMTFPITATGTNQISVPANHAYIRSGDVVALFNSEMQFDDSASWRIAGITSNPAAHTDTLTLDHPIPPSDKGGFLVDLNFSGARYVVRNNQFLHNRARGALLQTPYGLIEGNTFSGQTMYPLLLTTFPPEGPGAQNLRITNNQISDSGVGGGPGAIIIARQRLIFSALAHNPPAQQNLIFVDNLIHDVPGPAFYISSANAVTLYRNTLQNTNYQTTDNKWNGAGDINSPIVINDASNILLLHNSIHPAPEVKTPISVDAGTTTGIKISEGTP